jgi:hypothetical protein
MVLLAAACNASSPSGENTFLLRGAGGDLQAVGDRVLQALALALRAQDVLEPRYPVKGYVMTAPDPSDAGAEQMRCMEGERAAPDDAACLLLNQGGDFVRVLPITWESAAPYMHRIYVAPRSLLAKVNPARDFVAIDVFLFQEPALRDAVGQAIRAAAAGLGARPFRP